MILCALLLISVSAGCARENDEGSGEPYYIFTDSEGREIVLAEKPEKIAVLFSSYAEVWRLAGGSVDITVGESIERGFADNDAELVDSGAGKTINNESLVLCKPDFVIASADIKAHTDTAAILSDAGIPCALFRVDTFSEYLTMLKICTDITGSNDAYEANGIKVRDEIDAILSAAESAEHEPKILFIRSGSGGSSAKAKTAEQHFAAAMLSELGAYNIADNVPVLLDGLSLEEILAEAPAHIFISTMGDETAARAYMDSVLAQNAWSALTAVKMGEYTYLPKDMFQFKPNARWADAYRYLAQVLYPELDF